MSYVECLGLNGYSNLTDFFDIQSTETTLTSTQIVLLIWLIICAAPNLFLICILLKHKLYQSNFYCIIGNWCLANIFQILDRVYIAAVPKLYISCYTSNIMEIAYWIFSTVPVIFATLLLFDLFINSRKSCIYSIYNIWISTLINVVLTIVCIVFDYTSEALTVVSAIVIGNLSLIILNIKGAIYCCRSSHEEQYSLRLALSTYCILSNFTVPLFLLSTYFVSLLVSENFFCVALFVSTTSGLAMLILLTSFDDEIKYRFYQLFGYKHESFAVQYSSAKSKDVENGATEMEDKTKNT